MTSVSSRSHPARSRRPAAPAQAIAPLDAVLAALAGRVAEARLPLARAFVRDFYRHLQDDEFRHHSVEAWAAMAVDMLDFATRRRPGQAKVRVFNPHRRRHGWESVHTVLEIVNDDMPFLVDSVGLALSTLGIGVHVMGHPVLRLDRDRGGELVTVGEGRVESLMLLEIDRQPPQAMAWVEAAVKRTLADVRAIVDDWSAMRGQMLTLAEDLATRPMPVDDADRHEAQAFLRWAADDHFVFFGYRAYRVERRGRGGRLVPEADSGLGLLRKPSGRVHPVASLAAHTLGEVQAIEPLILTKTGARSPVHRSGYMDYIGVLAFDARGRIVGEQRFLGMFTSGAYNRRPWDIPLVRRRYEQVMARSGLAPGSHSGKALRHILETLPREELFQSTGEELYRTAMGVLGLQERVRSRLFMRRDRYGRFISVLVYIPRDRFNTDVRLRIEGLLKQTLQGEHVDSSVVLGDSPLAQLHLIVRAGPGQVLALDATALEARLDHLLRNWHDDLRERLVARHGEDAGLRLASSIGRALPAGYIEESSVESAASDVENLAALTGPDDLRLSLQAAQRTDRAGLRLKLYRQLDDIPLSDVLPMMENMGLRVIAERPHRLQVDGQPVYVQDFEVESGVGAIALEAVAPLFEEAFARTWQGEAENDGFNRLVLAAALDWRQVAMLRSYCKYLLQTGVPFSQTYVEATFARHPLLARLLAELFQARFQPGPERPGKARVTAERQRLQSQLMTLGGDDAATATVLSPVLAACSRGRAEREAAIVQAVRTLLDLRVSSLDEDRILRSFLGAIAATVRTSYYQVGVEGRPAATIAYKFDSAKVPDLPKPHPYREIFVCGPRVEGIHLRFGPVARGGLRWSDRREDFRTEVLGLVKAQMVKNTVIVPVGAKGGFIVKRPPLTGDRDALQAEGVACYRQFVQGLLDLTDNLVDGRIVPPVDVVRHDGDDPYLVVAADKGTSTFSDIANGIAQAHGYWLDDAFASGGSVGYDHKGMGITARGAWESVQRHFRALGRDCQNEDFTCVGIGDMSGDVFGNGMLLSRHIRLVAAFDHRHVFLDPTPDAAASFAERERLSRLPRSSWADYDADRISAGGGVWPRSAKSIPLSPQARAALSIADTVEALSPNALVNAILKAPVDLLWNGGIGTYVKSSRETHADVGDRANDGLRVDGCELRCKVVGEGGNLGCTQRGRIEAALHGVLLNTDFIDNSAGVDTSDHEVNIKILLNAEVRNGRLKPAARNRLLAAMTEEVAALVLTDNYRQNQALSLMERMSLRRLGSKQHFIQTLEAQGLLDRQIEFLPTDAEIAERKAKGQGLTRPELAVLLAYAKLTAFQQLLATDVPEDPHLSQELARYFPSPLRKKYAAAMADHRLRREIIATAVTNATVNRMGSTFLLRMQEDTGRDIGEVAKAYTISRETLDARALWRQIDALDGRVPEAVQIDALEVIWRLQRALVRWLLLRPGPIPAISDAVARYRAPFEAIRVAADVLPPGRRAEYQSRVAHWRDKGVPAPLAIQLAELGYLAPAFDIIELAAARAQVPVEVARVYFRLGEALHLPWLAGQIDALQVEGRWHAIARGVLRDQLAAHQRDLAGQALTCDGEDAAARVALWLDRDDGRLRFVRSMLQELEAQPVLDYPTASVAVQRLGQLAVAG